VSWSSHFALGLLTTVVVAVGCSSARRGEPIAGPLASLSADEHTGRTVFMQSCHQCHPGGMAGLGPAINDKPLPAWLVKMQVRQGLGAMPEFGETEISDAELDALAEYVSALRSAERRVRVD
jgi:mono/diheme cytochrome c family protein